MLSRQLEGRAPSGASDAGELAERRRWMGVLARADEAALEGFWRDLGDVALEVVRSPEIGLVMTRGRAGGTGQRFNLGEMTVTRAAVRTADGTLGHAFVKGRAKRHAELAACFDALLQDPARRPTLLEAVIAPLERAEAERRRALVAKAAATRVDFFTMARGEG